MEECAELLQQATNGVLAAEDTFQLGHPAVDLKLGDIRVLRYCWILGKYAKDRHLGGSSFVVGRRKQSK